MKEGVINQVAQSWVLISRNAQLVYILHKVPNIKKKERKKKKKEDWALKSKTDHSL